MPKIYTQKETANGMLQIAVKCFHYKLKLMTVDKGERNVLFIYFPMLSHKNKIFSLIYGLKAKGN